MPQAFRAIWSVLTIATLCAGDRVAAMQDDLARAERYDSLVATLRRAAEDVTDEKRRADLLSLASHYESLAESIAGHRRLR